MQKSLNYKQLNVKDENKEEVKHSFQVSGLSYSISGGSSDGKKEYRRYSLGE